MTTTFARKKACFLRSKNSKMKNTFVKKMACNLLFIVIDTHMVMKKGLILTSLLFLFAFIARSQVAHELRAAPAASPPITNCPYQTAEEWQLFLEHYSGDEKWVETCEDSSCDTQYYQFVKENIQSIFDRCESFFSQHTRIAQCTENMRHFTPFWLKQHDSRSYGFLKDNRAYFAAEDSSENPEGMMKVPDAIIAALPYRDQVEKAARENGYEYLTHDSAIDGFRTFIFIPDPKGRYDKWMLLNLKSGKSTVQEKTQLSVLAVQKEDLDGNRLPKVRLNFRDYMITRNPGLKSYGLTLSETGNGKCFSCHSDGVRQLIPYHTKVLQAEPVKGEAFPQSQDFAFDRLMEFNRRLRSYGTPDWNGNVIPSHLGPTLGTGQSCTDCHNGVSRAPLTVFTSMGQIKQKMYQELSMPPDTDFPRLIDYVQAHKSVMTKDQSEASSNLLKEARGMHAALAQDYESSRLPALKEWFLETTCR